MTNAKQTLIDIGVNLTGRAFASDLPEVIERARQEGVATMVVTGTNLQHSEEAVELCERWPSVLLATAGVHPHHASEWNDKVAYGIHQCAEQASVRSIGECGLDFNRNYSSPSDQKRAFEAQLEIAADVQLPVFLHQRDAHQDFLDILSRWRDKLTAGVAHCFTGTLEEAKAYLDLDLSIGVTGWLCDERRGQSLQEAVKNLPLECLMIESDAPYLLPRDLPENYSRQLNERRNEPLVLPHICQSLAKIKGLEPEQVAISTTNLARQFFAISE